MGSLPRERRGAFPYSDQWKKELKLHHKNDVIFPQLEQMNRSLANQKSFLSGPTTLETIQDLETMGHI